MKYKLEGNINFYESLVDCLDNDSDDEDQLCKISGYPLDDNLITLECGHKFNYTPLYKEICRQKFDFKTYDIHILTRWDQKKVLDSKLDYFIKCPYCRNIQFSILPLKEELGLNLVYGINTLDKKYKMKNYPTDRLPLYNSDNYQISYYGVTFKKGTCCETENNFICKSKLVAFIPNTELSYCTFHYRIGLKKYKLKEKQKKVEEKKKEKEEILKARQKLLDEKNLIRAEKGLQPLKSLPRIKPVIENVINPGQPIGQYVPDEETNINILVDQNNNDSINKNIIKENIKSCKIILKTGTNKGKQCGCLKVNDNNICKRHEKAIL